MTTGSDCPEAWDLVAAAQRGDREAYGQLYRRYADGVSRFLGSRVRDRGVVEDLTSETFLRGWRRIDSVSDQGTDVGAWLTTIARNLVFDHTKSSRYKRETTVADVADVGSGEAGPEQAVINKEATAGLWRQVGQLPPDQRECVRLRFIEDLSTAQTAEAMGRTDTAIKPLRHRAISNLRVAMTTDTAPPVPAPRATVTGLVSARDAVAQAHQLVAGAERQPAPDRAQRLARWHTDDQTTARELDGDTRTLTEGVA